ncbi:MAG: polysaccharide biosynthesis/export family protein, partial [Planctomycetota bacterium]
MRMPILIPCLLIVACASKGDTRPAVEALIEQGHQREAVKLDLKVKTVETKLPPQKEGYRIGVNDVLDVRVPGHPEFGGDLTRADAKAFGFRVMEDGKVYLPHIGGVPAAGRTPIELQDDLNERMHKFLKDPYVSAYVLRYESQK